MCLFGLSFNGGVNYIIFNYIFNYNPQALTDKGFKHSFPNSNVV